MRNNKVDFYQKEQILHTHTHIGLFQKPDHSYTQHLPHNFALRYETMAGKINSDPGIVWHGIDIMLHTNEQINQH